MGVQRGQEATGDFRDLLDRAVERHFVGLRRLVETGKLSHELQRRGLDLMLGRRRLEIEQRLDVAAHYPSCSFIDLAPLPGSAGKAFPKDDPVTQIATSRCILS